MSKVTKVTPMLQGHTRVEYEDGSQSIVQRGTPVPTVGEDYAVDQKASEETPIVGESAVSGATGQDESGVAQQSSDGPREEGQPSTEEKQDGPQAS